MPHQFDNGHHTLFLSFSVDLPASSFAYPILLTLEGDSKSTKRVSTSSNYQIKLDHLQVKVFPRPRRLVWIIRDILNNESFLDGLDKRQVRSSAFLEAKVAYCVRPNQILQRLLQKGERRLKVYTLGSKNDIGVLWNIRWYRTSPIIDGRFHFALERI